MSVYQPREKIPGHRARGKGEAKEAQRTQNVRWPHTQVPTLHPNTPRERPPYILLPRYLAYLGPVPALSCNNSIATITATPDMCETVTVHRALSYSFCRH